MLLASVQAVPYSTLKRISRLEDDNCWDMEALQHNGWEVPFPHRCTDSILDSLRIT